MTGPSGPTKGRGDRRRMSFVLPILRAGFPFQWALGARDAGHEAEIFAAGEAVSLMKGTVADAVLPVAMPAFKDLIDEVVAQRVPIFV